MTELAAEKRARQDLALRLAKTALTEFGRAGAKLKLLKLTDVVMFRVAAEARYVLRLHPPDRHPRHMIESELLWLTMVREATGLRVPDPIPAPDGRRLVDVEVDGAVRHAALFRWMPGHAKLRSMTAADARRLGHALGTLHRFAETFVEPSGFERWPFDLGEFESITEVLEREPDLFTPEELTLLLRTTERTRDGIQAVGQHRTTYGLIQADTNLTNVLFDGLQVALIDFECFCYGYYLFDVTRALLGIEQFSRQPDRLTTALHHGYTEVRPLPALDSAEIVTFKLMNLLDCLLWLAQLKPHNLKYDMSAHRSYWWRQLRELMEERR